MKSFFAALVLIFAAQAKAVPIRLLNEVLDVKEIQGMKITEINELASFRCLGCYKIEVNGTSETDTPAIVVVSSRGNQDGSFEFTVESSSNDSKFAMKNNKILKTILTPSLENMIEVVAGVKNVSQMKLEKVMDENKFYEYSFSGDGSKALVQAAVSPSGLQVGVRKAPNAESK